MALTITQQPQSSSVSLGGSANFSVSAETDFTAITADYGNTDSFGNGDWTEAAATVTLGAAEAVAASGSSAHVGGIQVGKTISFKATLTSGTDFLVPLFTNDALTEGLRVRTDGSTVKITYTDNGWGPESSANLVSRAPTAGDYVIVQFTLLTASSVELSIGYYNSSDSLDGSQSFTLGIDDGAPVYSDYKNYIGSASGSVTTYDYYTISTEATITYQWKKDTVDIPAETNSTLSIATVSHGDYADYTVSVSDSNETVLSNIAVLSLQAVPGAEYAELGKMYFSTALGKPVWWNGSWLVDSEGNPV